MPSVTIATNHRQLPHSTQSKLRSGATLGLVSALAYTAANVFLRHVAIDCDPAWVSCTKAVPAALVGWWLVLQGMRRGKRMMPPPELMRPLIGLAIFVQLSGNIAFQWSLGQIGLALAVPLSFGTIIVGGAMLGRIWLSEPITVRSAIAIAVLIVAVGVLGMGAAPEQQASSTATMTTPRIMLGAIAACTAGFAYAVNTTYIRAMALGVMPVATTLMVISTTGVILHGLLSLVRIGWIGMVATTPQQWIAMIGAGVFNAIAFFTLGYALQRITVLHVNLLNASQVAMAAITGVMLFGEKTSTAMFVGCVLTTIGMVLVQGHIKDPALERAERADNPVARKQGKTPEEPFSQPPKTVSTMD